jgi:hypothetical protein
VIKTLIQWARAFVNAQMPLADMRGGVASTLERLGDGDFRGW